jgi:hypothetical protein
MVVRNEYGFGAQSNTTLVKRAKPGLKRANPCAKPGFKPGLARF